MLPVRKYIAKKPRLIPVKSPVNGLIPISKVAISGITFIAWPSCFTDSIKLLSVIIIAGITSLPAIPVINSINQPAVCPTLPYFLLNEPTTNPINSLTIANRIISKIFLIALLKPEIRVASLS